MMIRSFLLYTQLDSMDCGPTCLRMIARYYGRIFFVQYLRKHSFITRVGVSMLGISDAAEYTGFRTQGVKITFEQRMEEKPLPLHPPLEPKPLCSKEGAKRERRVQNTDCRSNWAEVHPEQGRIFALLGKHRRTRRQGRHGIAIGTHAGVLCTG
jgi:ABC-type bacteriocin/lantibiotic exporter with double-glycine peptidase domain